MSDRDPDDESTEDLWDEVAEFADADPDEVAEFSDTESSEVEAVVETDAVEVEEVTHTEPTDEPIPNGVDDHESATVDDELPNTEDAPDTDEVFDEMDVSAVDGEALWDELAGAETDAGSFDGDDAAAVDAEVGEPIDAEPVESSVDTEPSVDTESTGDRSTAGSTDGTETLVDKRAYCQQCPYFSEPPEVSCRHDGTEIIEVIKDGRFRVRSCPVVTETGPDRTILNDGP